MIYVVSGLEDRWPVTGWKNMKFSRRHATFSTFWIFTQPYNDRDIEFFHVRLKWIGNIGIHRCENAQGNLVGLERASIYSVVASSVVVKVTVKIVTTRQEPVTQGERNNLQSLKRLMFTLDLPQNFFVRSEHEGVLEPCTFNVIDLSPIIQANFQTFFPK